MSRSGYSYDCDDWALIRWRGAVDKAILGTRGQHFLHDLRDALDAMPVKRLIKDALQQDGEVCALGAVGVKRGIDMSTIDPEERDDVAAAFNIAPALAAEVACVNDDDYDWVHESSEQRWQRVRRWVDDQIPKEMAP